MSKNNPVLKNAQKLGREQQKSIAGGAVRCCERDKNRKMPCLGYAYMPVNKKKPPHPHS